MLLRKTFVDTRELKKAYLAGIFDGEGSISIIRHPDTVIPLLHIAISQTNFPFLNEISKIYGGNCSENKNGCWNWQLYGAAKQVRFLSAIQPYAILKAEEIAISIELCRLTPEKGQNVKHTQDERTQLLRFKLLELLEAAADRRRTEFRNRG